MTITSLKHRIAVLILCWTIVGYSIHMLVQQQLLKYTLLKTQKNTRGEHYSTMSMRLQETKNQVSNLQNRFNTVFKSLTTNSSTKTLIDLVNSTHLQVRAFSPRDYRDHGWYQQEVIELILEGSCNEITQFLNQGGAYGMLTAFAVTILKPNIIECSMMWHCLTIERKTLGATCSILPNLSTLITIPEIGKKADFSTQTDKSISLRGIIALNNRRAALIYWGQNALTITEGDEIGDYTINSIEHDSLTINHKQTGQSTLFI